MLLTLLKIKYDNYAIDKIALYKYTFFSFWNQDFFGNSSQ